MDGSANPSVLELEGTRVYLIEPLIAQMQGDHISEELKLR